MLGGCFLVAWQMASRGVLSLFLSELPKLVLQFVDFEKPLEEVFQFGPRPD